MKENKRGKGWHEAPEQVITAKGIKKVAPRHRIAAIKESLKDVMRTPMVAPEPEKTTKSAGVDIDVDVDTHRDVNVNVGVDVEEEEKEETKETEEETGKISEEVPVLAGLSLKQGEDDEPVEISFAVPLKRTGWMQKFAGKNGLIITQDGTVGTTQIPESKVIEFMNAIGFLEEEFEEECRAERVKADISDDDEDSQ